MRLAMWYEYVACDFEHGCNDIHCVVTHNLWNYLGWRRMLDRYGKGVDIRDCLHEVLGRHMKHVMGA
ncbi:hypothetical protein BSP75_06425 [Aeromonas sp. YN13HZO-058]|nr:hypothetical protein BSP75_06425 [Aeromonas sp. YN13HZO-058]BBT81010.1 hypothetical protein WP8S18E11_26760 [Aeromonas veronii]